MTIKLKKNAKYRHVNNPKYVIQVIDTKKKVTLVKVLNTTEGHGTKGDLYLIPRIKVDHYQQVDIKKTTPKKVTRWMIVSTNQETLLSERPPVAKIGEVYLGRTIAAIHKIEVTI